MCGKRKASKPVPARRKRQATPALRSATWQRIYITPSETPTAARGEPLNRLFYLSLPHGGVRISLFAVLAFAATLAADCSVFTVLIFAAAFVHELGHLICLKTNGVNIYGITVLPFGAVIRSDAEKLTYRKEAQAALAGPFAGLCAAAVSGMLFFVFRDPYTLFFAAANLTLSFVNLVPVRTLDGGRALEALAFSRMPFEKAESFAENVSYGAFVFLTFASLGLLAFTGCNFSLVIFCVCLFISAYGKRNA